VIDAHRGLDVYRRLLETERLRLRAVFDTHLQADHVSGGPRSLGTPASRTTRASTTSPAAPSSSRT
jgi:glyoxylase-like metal-dependent hydrolase (beta-lactamase superfamily II)